MILRCIIIIIIKKKECREMRNEELRRIAENSE